MIFLCTQTALGPNDSVVNGHLLVSTVSTTQEPNVVLALEDKKNVRVREG